MNWADAIKHHRRQRGLTQAALAADLNIDPTTVSRWERGRDLPSLSVQTQLRKMILPTVSNLDRALRDMIDTTGDIAVLLDRDYRLVRASKAHQDMLKYDPTTMYGQKFPFWTDRMHQIISHCGGPEGWWKNGIYSMDFMSCRKPQERAGNQEILYQRVRTITIKDSTGDCLRFSLTRRIPMQAFADAPPVFETF
jgi:transcriptional regulator with XRE-family HTH domain